MEGRCKLGLQKALNLLGEVWARHPSVNNDRVSGVDGAMDRSVGTLIIRGASDQESARPSPRALLQGGEGAEWAQSHRHRACRGQNSSSSAQLTGKTRAGGAELTHWSQVSSRIFRGTRRIRDPPRLQGGSESVGGAERRKWL